MLLFITTLSCIAVGFIAPQFNVSEGDGYVNVTIALLLGVLRNEVNISVTTDSSDAIGKF